MNELYMDSCNHGRMNQCMNASMDAWIYRSMDPWGLRDPKVKLVTMGEWVGIGLGLSWGCKTSCIGRSEDLSLITRVFPGCNRMGARY